MTLTLLTITALILWGKIDAARERKARREFRGPWS